jgi:hypothetical protein
MEQGEPVSRQLNNLKADIATLHAEVIALIELCEAIAQAVGIATVNGLSVIDWWARRRGIELRRTLEELKDIDPATTAILEAKIAESSRHARGSEAD